MHDAVYQTKDIGLATALLTAGQPIKTILWKDAVALSFDGRYCTAG